jgi:hypothetical protein
MNDEWWIGDDVERSDHCLILLLPRNFLGTAEQNLENPQTERPIFGPRFERGTSRIRSTRVNQSTTTFGVVFVICVHTQWLIELLGLHEIYKLFVPACIDPTVYAMYNRPKWQRFISEQLNTILLRRSVWTSWFLFSRNFTFLKKGICIWSSMLLRFTYENII